MASSHGRLFAQTDANRVTVASYRISGANADDVATQLKQQLGNIGNVSIVADPRTNRLIVRAPSGIHEQIRLKLRDSQSLDNEASSSPPKASSSEGRVSDAMPPKLVRSVGKLDHVDWRQLIAAVQSMSQQRITMKPVEQGRSLAATLPATRGATEFQITPESGQYQLRGEASLVAAWRRAIDSIDSPRSAEATKLYPLETAKRTSFDRAMRLVRKAQKDAQEGLWQADVVGVRRKATKQPVQIAQAPVETDEGTPPPRPQQNSDEVGVDGALVGPGPVIEYVEGLDAIIIRGRRQDVERIMEIVGDLEELSAETEPAIELMPLQHVNSQSMADLVNQLSEQTLSIRLGTVSITPLIKPNALLLIGRKEAVEATMELIKRLDQPVSPTSQFQIFRLEHVPANDALETVSAFYEGREGLGPRVQLQADFRTNSLIVYASPRDMLEVAQLLKEIDIGDMKASSEVRVFKLNNALAEELAPVLEATLRGEPPPTTGATGGTGGTTSNVSPRSTTLTLTRFDALGKRILKSGILTEVRVAADIRANSLVVTAPANSMELIAALVQQLDELPTSETEIKVFNIVNGEAIELVDMLNELFGTADQSDQQGPLQSAAGAGESSLIPLRFSTDERTNSIIATGSSADLAVVDAILLRLDQGDRSQRRNRVYRLQHAPAQSVADAISNFLATQRQLQQEIAPESVSPYAQYEREVIVVPELVSNSLIISATPEYFDEIANLIKVLDERPPMVMIQVLIAEVTLGSAEELGVELGLQDSLLFDRGVLTDVVTPGFNFNNSALGNSSSNQSLATRNNVAGQSLTNFALGRNNSQLGYGGLVLSASSESVSVLIRALQEERRLDVLSRPQVMTLNNQPAFILVGQRVPRVESSTITATGTQNSIVLDNVGLLIGVTPRISPDGLVVMEVDAEQSDLGPIDEGIPVSINVAGDVIRSPIINTTTAQTTVSARSGQTVILGGLITKDRNVIDRTVPYLGSIPVLGNLFRYDSVSELRTELLIILTPYVVRKEEDSDLLNQIESQRMSWCLADVISIQGETGMTSGGINPPSLTTHVIYPDNMPSAPTNPLGAEAIPPGDREYIVPGSIRELPLSQPGAMETLPPQSDQRDPPTPPPSDAASNDQGKGRFMGRLRHFRPPGFRELAEGTARLLPRRDRKADADGSVVPVKYEEIESTWPASDRR